MKIVEATLIMPATCLILIALIGLIMNFYTELNTQISENAALREGIYETREVTVIRIRDRIRYEDYIEEYKRFLYGFHYFGLFRNFDYGYCSDKCSRSAGHRQYFSAFRKTVGAKHFGRIRQNPEGKIWSFRVLW